MNNPIAHEITHVLLDMGNTFMFGCDRFGPNRDYHATYQRLGGKSLAPANISSHITRLFDTILEIYRDPARHDDFGNAHRYFQTDPLISKLLPAETDLLLALFAYHECGTISPEHAEAIHALAGIHPLGLVSNIWSSRTIYETEFTRAGILNCFTFGLFSSDGLSIKPSPLIFQQALAAFGNPDPAPVLFVGDDPKRDIAPASALGMRTAWIKNLQRPLTPDIPQPDFILPDLTDLVPVLRRSHMHSQQSRSGN
jgi:FMN phosphatase YigB (HAD superfamily)